MTKIARYIDDPPQIFFWDIDEIIIFGMFFGIGMLANILTIMIFIAIGVNLLFSRVKQCRSDGFFLHILYWLGILRLRECPPSYIRSYYE